MNEIILDTSFLVGLLDERDIWHEKSCEIYENLINKKFVIYFLDCVANETITVISRRYKKTKGEELLIKIFNKFEDLVKPEIINWAYEKIKEFYIEIINMIRAFKGELTFHDALIVLIAKKNKIPYIASFDVDFDRVEGIVRVKDKKSLEVK